MRFIPCEVCGTNQHRFLFKGRDRIFGLPGAFTVVQCEECGLIFMNPQVEIEMLKQYYPKEYYGIRPPVYREYSWIREKLLKTYFGYKNCSNHSKSLLLLGKVGFFPFKIWYSHAIPFVQNGRLLDIGCGNGTELYKLKKMGWETYGVEVDPEASERARFKGLSVFTGGLFEANFPNNFFDVVRMSFVLEHLPNPRETLMEIKRILRPEGRIYMSIQNARSLNYWLFKERWFSLDIPRHLFSFSPETIGRLLSSSGLEIKALRFDSGTRTFLMSLQYWMNDRYQRRREVWMNQPIRSSHFLRRLLGPFCWMVDRLRLGDLMHLEVIKV